MILKITFEFLSVEEAARFLRRLELPVASVVTAGPTVIEAPTGQPKIEQKRRGRPPRAATPAEAPAPAPVIEPAAPESVPTSAPSQEGACTTSPAAAAPTTEDAKAALEAVFEKRGYQGAQQLISTFGVSKLRDLDPEQYPAFIAKAAELAKGE